MKNIKSEKASISAFVIVAFLFCMTILINVYWSNTNYQITALQARQRIAEIYGEDVKRATEIQAAIESGSIAGGGG